MGARVHHRSTRAVSPGRRNGRSSSEGADRRYPARTRVATLRPVATGTALAAIAGEDVANSHPDAAVASVSSAVVRPDRDRYPAVMWILLAGNLLVRSAGFAYPFLAYHVAGRGHQAGAVGVVLAAYGAGWAAGQLLCGWLVDRYGARSTLVSTMAVAAAVLMLIAAAHSVPVLSVAAMIAGLTCDTPRLVLGSAITALIADPRHRARLDTWRYGWVLNIGAAIAGAVGGLVAEWMGTSLLYWINGIVYATFAVMTVRCIPAGRYRAATPVTAHDRGDYRQIFADKRLVLLVASGWATLTVLMGIFAVVPMLMNASGLGTGAYGWVQVVNGVAVAALTPLMTPWLSKQLAVGPRLDMLAVAGVWVTLCMGVAGIAHTTAGFSAAVAACSPGEIVWFVVSAGIVHRITQPASSGRYQGVWSMTTAAAALTAPILAACSLAHGGRLLMVGATVTAGLLGTALCAPLARALAGADIGRAPRNHGRRCC
ncbi:hypothetical protein C3469_11505 [Mycobacterium kansasii]|nr:hypothetical protein C3479_09455 [Mycobacterium kansasii]POY27378.1 hypothetical protein C3469_11505 [Mycobacterium kansasii]POY32668.1 hypothetical protein C3478_10285 [Mycobacterium kansasii]